MKIRKDRLNPCKQLIIIKTNTNPSKIGIIHEIYPGICKNRIYRGMTADAMQFNFTARDFEVIAIFKQDINRIVTSKLIGADIV